MGHRVLTVIIVGANSLGRSVIELYRDSRDVCIAGVVDRSARAGGMKLARELKIPTACTLGQLKTDGKRIDAIFNISKGKGIQKSALKGNMQRAAVIENDGVRLIIDTAKRAWDAGRIAEEEIKKSKEELDIQAWGLKKTNDAIKLLYKELEEKNKRLQELDRIKSEFISTVSHELRTPLAITKEGIGLVLDRIPGEINERQEKILATARNSIDRLGRIINNLLSISKIEAGKVKLKKDLVDIVSVVRQAFSAFEQRAQEKGLELKGTFDHERIDLYCDVDRMIEVFTNLIGNAMKFVEKGHIEVIIRDTGEEVECVVADTGIGISKEDLPKVFGKFQQFGRTDGPGEKGTGLGLAISKKIVEMHKGRMWVESEYKVGTEFHFTMPKYTTEMLFKEYVDTGIKEAMKNDVKMSIVVISLGGVNELKRSIPAEKMQVLLADMKKAIDGNLHQEGETVVKDSGEIIVLLAGYDKEGAVRIEKRLQGILQEHLARLDLAGAITTHFGCATYPDEAENDEDLINRAKGEPQG